MFTVTRASIPGSDHSMPGKPSWKNNQDASFMYSDNLITVGIVADGCGSGCRSEVGANLGAQLLGTMLVKSMHRTLTSGTVSIDWKRLRLELLGQISVVATKMGDSLSKVVSDYFLFSILGFVVIEETTSIFSIGDGSYFINGVETKCGPFSNNAPPYVAYALLGMEEPQFEIVTRATEEITSIAVGTDGVDYIENVQSTLQTWLSTESMFSHPDLLRRRLAVMNCEKVHNGILIPGPLKDDTTLVLAKRLP